MKVLLEKDNLNLVWAIRIIPETPADKAALQKLKTDSDKKIEVAVNDLNKTSEYSSAKIVIEFRPYYH